MINDNPSVFKDLKELFPDLSEKTGLTDEQMQVILENMYYLYHNLGLANIDVGNTTTNFTAPGVFSNTELSHREEEVNGTIVDYLDFKFNIPTPKIQTEIITNTVSTPDDVNIDIINYPIIETINGQNVTTGYKFSFRADLYKGEGLKQNEIISRDTISIPTIDTPDFVQDGEVLKYKKKNGDTYTYESFGGSLSDDYVTTNTEQSITATKTIELPMNVGNGYTGLIFKKGAGGGTAPKAMTFVDENDNSIAIVSVVSETIDFSGNVTFRNNLNSFSIDEVPTNIEITTNQSNKTITTALKNDSGTILSTSTANLPIENSFTEEDKENLDANTSARHIHSNKDVLDGTTASYTVEEKGKLNGIEAQANRVTSTSQILNDSGYITIDNVPTTLAELSSDATHRTVTDAEKESWNSKLSQFTETDPTVPTYVKNITEEDITNWNSKVNISDIPTKTSQLTNDSGYITNQVNNLVNYTLATNTGSTIEVSVDSNTFIGTISLKNNSGTVISSGTFDLPLETVVVNGYFDEDTKKIVLVLQNGNEISIDASSLINGLASQSDLTSLTNTVNNKVDKVTGKGLSSNDFTDTDKNNLDANTTSRHTHSNKSVLDATTASYTTTEKSKLSGIETGAQVNVQADWNESNTASSAYIKNKPTIPADLSGTVVTLDGTQTITGIKRFRNEFDVGVEGEYLYNTIHVTDKTIDFSITAGDALNLYQNKINISSVGIQVITENTTKFTYNGNEVATLEELNNIKNNILDEVYPVGSIYLSLDPSFKPPEKFGGEWTRLVFPGTLWFGGTDEEIGQLIEPGLPNITGQIAGACYESSTISGAFATVNTSACTLGTKGGSVVKYNTFDASRSSSIYGNSDTVQPYAMRVALWQRTA